MKYCGSCGKQIPESKNFCGYCGEVQPDAGSPVVFAAQAPEHPDSQPKAKSSGSKKSGLVIGIIVGALVIIGGSVGATLAVVGATSGVAKVALPDASAAASILASMAPSVAVGPVLPAHCPVDEVQAVEPNYELITEDRTAVKLTCGLGVPNSGLGIGADYTVMSDEQWNALVSDFEANGAEPTPFGLGETAGYSATVEGMDGPETSFKARFGTIVLETTGVQHTLELFATPLQ